MRSSQGTTILTPGQTPAGPLRPARRTELAVIYKKFENEFDIDRGNEILVMALGWMDRKLREYAVQRRLTQDHADRYKKIEKIRARGADPGVPSPERETSLCMALRSLEKIFDANDLVMLDPYFQRREEMLKKAASKKTTKAAAKTTAKTKTRKAGNRRGDFTIEVVSVPVLKDGTDRKLCFSAIEGGNGKLTVKEYLDLTAPKCKKAINAGWYLSSFVTAQYVKLVAPPAKVVLASTAPLTYPLT